MILTGIVNFATGHVGWAITIAFISLSLLITFLQRFPVLGFYSLTVLLAFVVSAETGGVSYFIAFMLGMATAFAEVIGKFRDEPLKAFRTPQALAYHTLNGCISVFAFYVLKISGIPLTNDIDKLKAILLAGLGSMLIMRSRLFNLKVGDEEMAFGPDQIIKIYFRFMENAIDRVRAKSRMDLVRSLMNNINFNAVYDITRVMLDSSQTILKEKREKLEEELKKIRAKGPSDMQNKSYKLGFLLINEMGEDFVYELFNNPPRQWLISSPRPEKDEGWHKVITGVGGKPNMVSFFSYGASMDQKTFSDRLGWKAEDQEYLSENSRPASLKGYRLVFNKPSAEKGSNEGLPNIVEDENSVVNGVLYNLEETAFYVYADKAESGYEIQTVEVTVDGDKDQSVTALTFVAPETREGLVPSKEKLRLVMRGARSHKLGVEYLQEFMTDMKEAIPSDAKE